jgi:hypothetical protein
VGGVAEGVRSTSDPAAGPLRFAAVMAVVFMVSLVRLPATFIYPTFWAEDATEIFRTGIEQGALALVTPLAGMYLTIPRVLAWMVTALPVRHAPLAYAIAAGLVSSAGLAVFSRPGFRWLVPSDRLRAAFCLLLPMFSGMTECFFALITLTYVLFVAALLLLLERSDDGTWLMGWRRAAFLSFLWFSIGQAAVLVPLLLYLLWITRNRRYLVCLGTLAVSAVLNLTSGNPHAPEIRPSLPQLAEVFSDNIFVRQLFLPVLGRPRLGPILALSDPAFVILSLLVLQAVAWAIARTTTIDGRGWCALAVAVACVHAVFPVTAITRYYALPTLLRPNLAFGGRYDIAPGVLALVLGAAVLAPAATRWQKTAAALLMALIAINLRAQPLYEPPQPFRPFVWEWPRQSDRIERALSRRQSGRLRRPVVVSDILCRPGPPFGPLRTIVISP